MVEIDEPSSASSASSFAKSDFDAESLHLSPFRSSPSASFGETQPPFALPAGVNASKFVLKVKIDEGNGSSRLIRIRLAELQNGNMGSLFDALIKFISAIVPFDHVIFSTEISYQDEDDDCVQIVTTMGLLDAIEQNAAKNVLRITAELKSNRIICTVIMISTESKGNHRVSLAQLMDESGDISFDKLMKLIVAFMECDEEFFHSSIKLQYESEGGDTMTISSTESLLDALEQKTADEVLCVTTSTGIGYCNLICADATATTHSDAESCVDAARSTDAPVDPEAQNQAETSDVISSPKEWKKLGDALAHETNGLGCNSSVALSQDGKIMAVGSPKYDSERGAVRVYKRGNDGSWIQLGSDIKARSEYVGYSVALSADGKFMAVGSPFNNDNGYCSGRVKMFEFSKGGWRQRGRSIRGKKSQSRFGWSVSLSGDGTVVAIGSSNNNIRVYEYSVNEWIQRGHDVIGTSNRIPFGRSVSLSCGGTTLAVGSPRSSSNSCGRVHVYDFVGGAWSLADIIDGKTPKSEFGHSVTLSSNGQMVAIGAPGSDDCKGAAHVYERSDGIWAQVGEDILGDASDDQCGEAVSLSSCGRILAVGSPYHGFDGENYCGVARVYELVESKWTRLGSDVFGGWTDERYGRVVVLSSDGKMLAVSSYICNEKKGRVNVYTL